MSPERRVQPQQAIEAAVEDSDRAYQEMVQIYKRMRKALIQFITTFAGIHAHFKHKAERIAPFLDDDCRTRFEVFIDLGCKLISEATAQARAILREQADIPIVDVFKVDLDGNVIDTLLYPLFPVIPRDESKRYF